MLFKGRELNEFHTLAAVPCSFPCRAIALANNLDTQYIQRSQHFVEHLIEKQKSVDLKCCVSRQPQALPQIRTNKTNGPLTIVFVQQEMLSHLHSTRFVVRQFGDAPSCFLKRTSSTSVRVRMSTEAERQSTAHSS